MAAVAVTILIILMLQLQSMSRMAMVFMTAPLGLIGVVIALLVTRASQPALRAVMARAFGV